MFEDISFSIAERQRVGLIAKNGTGKSTLLSVISGKEGYDSGSVIFRRDLKVGYLEQSPTFNPDETVLDACFNHKGENEKVLKAKQVLTQLKIKDLSQPMGQLSGGQQKRVALANVLLTEPDMLILDEPTNHLDLEMIEWLEGYLSHGNKTLLMVTHDRFFLDRVCSVILELDDNTIYTYRGNYSYYLEKRQERIDARRSEIARANNLYRTELEWMRRMPQARGHKARYREEAFYELEKIAKQRIEERQMRLKCRETDMVQFVERICRSYEFSAEERGIALSVRRVDNGVGNVEPLTAWIDRVNFDKVVTNLLSNAFKYTLDAGEITIDLGTDGKHLVMKVTDSGIGFGDEKSENLFRRFYQGRNSAENAVVGTGIGLNLTKKIVELHGGTIVAANRTDGHRGACITVSLPLGNSHLKPEDMFHDDKSAEIDKKKIIFHKGTILVVDDDSELSAYVAAELNQWYRVDVYSNGVDALQALLTGSYDLVVSDVVMPGMDGIALLRKIKHNPNISHIPVIMLSSKSEIADRLAGFKSGADAYLAKPFSIDELHARIDAMIDNVRRMRGKFTGAQQQRDRIEDIEVRGYDDNIMERVMKSVNAHIGDCDFNVDTLALEVGLSRAQLHRKIKEFTGVSTAKFVRNLRMEQAERLLREGKVNITQVAYSVGFSDQTYFSTVFKQYYGVKPSEYAKK